MQACQSPKPAHKNLLLARLLLLGAARVNRSLERTASGENMTFSWTAPFRNHAPSSNSNLRLTPFPIITIILSRIIVNRNNKAQQDTCVHNGLSGLSSVPARVS
jgi:hypothetical protein